MSRNRFKRKVSKPKKETKARVPSLLKLTHPDMSPVIWYLIMKSTKATNKRNPRGWFKVNRKHMSEITGLDYVHCKRVFRSISKLTLDVRGTARSDIKYSFNFSKLAEAYLAGILEVDKKRSKLSDKSSWVRLEGQSEDIYIYSYNTLLGKIDKYYIIGNDKKRQEQIKEEYQYAPVKEKTSKDPYVQLAIKLSEVIRTYKKYNHSMDQLRKWGSEFKALILVDGVDKVRVIDVLDWYKGQIGKKFVPMAMSGITFREKFLRLEACMDRQEDDYGEEETKSIDPYKIIADRCKDYSSMDIDRLEKAYDSAEELITDANVKLLVNNIIELSEWITESRPKNMDDRKNELLPPAKLISEFSKWLDSESWVDHVSEKTYKSNSRLIKLFIDRFSQNETRHQLTGKKNII